VQDLGEGNQRVEEWSPTTALTLLEEFRPVLLNLCRTRDSRLALVLDAFRGEAETFRDLNVDNEPSVFVSLLLNRLHDLDDWEAGLPASCGLLRALREKLARSLRNRIDAVLTRKPRGNSGPV
jgi:hypothetical protein